jgi:hypothetical protein
MEVAITSYTVHTCFLIKNQYVEEVGEVEELP